MFRFTPIRLPLGLKDHLVKRKIHRKNSYYDLLGVTPRASQADIKKAFYELSMKCHPDKTKGDDTKFREISTAYEVLGNLKLRKMYDKGYLPVGTSGSTYQNIRDDPTREPVTDFGEHFRQERSERKQGQPPPSGRSAAYDYDEWTRMHYSDTFTRSRSRIHEYQWIEYQKRKAAQEQQDPVIRMFAAITLIVLCSIMFNLAEDYDNPRSPPRTSND
ncbi:dnaJ homolog subfamily B member 9 [Folsomia candida]|uniref:DnaJ subfamily A member 1 n=1 Tax=Folsomia candida TaxID=158441 RepID=A0A226E518_FOLCA|nr:dnaJ homolog subfamily B member 9 [Folsomia candida]OXA52805.1 DnaJ subfamily A member 1 [Folsomia candida]